MNFNEMEIINKMRSIRFLRGGEEEIKIFEELNKKILECNDLDSIPYLCAIMEDDVNNCSVIEEVLETILILTKNHDTTSALFQIMVASKSMKGHADSWARIMHTQLLRDKDIRRVYVDCAKKCDDDSKQYILNILNIIDKKKKVKDVNINEIIYKIEEDN